jgi:hypothetical protein
MACADITPRKWHSRDFFRIARNRTQHSTPHRRMRRRSHANISAQISQFAGSSIPEKRWQARSSSSWRFESRAAGFGARRCMW